MTYRFTDTQAVLFDLDGTLVDTAMDFVHVLNAQRSHHGLPALKANVIRDTVSDGARALTKLGFGGNEGEQDFEEKRLELLELYAIKVGEEATLFAGMAEALDYLESQSILWGIVTNKPRRFTTTLLERLNLTSRSAVTVCPDDVSKAKPDPESLLLASQRIACAPEKVIYVGDHERDIQAGRAANMPTIAAKYGYIMDPNSCVQWQADHIIEHASELVELIC